MACVSVMHAAGLGLLIRDVASSRDAGGEAPVINLTLEPSPRFDAPSPPSPEVREKQPQAPAASAPAQQRPKVIVRDISAPSSDAFLSAAQTHKFAEPDAAVLAPVAAAASVTQRLSSEAGATQNGGGRVMGAAASRLEDDYAARVLAWVEQHKRAPSGGDHGVVTVQFLLDRRGTVRDLRLMRSSGSRGLDQAALDQIQNTQPFPRPEPGAAWRTRSFTLNIDYRVR
jgi:protein TonB